MKLRYYQRDAIDAAYNALRAGTGNPLIVIPTAGGKTPIIGTICRDAVNNWNGRVLILAHVKELLEQAADKIRAIDPTLPVGVYSAGLGRRDLGYSVTIAGIQSVYNKADKLGAYDLILIDECHLIPFSGDGMYRQFLADMKLINPKVRCIGLTATPYRMKGGAIVGDEHIFDDICYEIGVKELIAEGFISKLRTKSGIARADTTGISLRAGEFVAKQLEELVDDDDLVADAVRETVELTKDRNAVLIFTAGKAHGEHVQRELQDKHNIESEFITGDTPSGDRDRILAEFKTGRLKYLININVLTTGFDAPNIDCVVMLRPTNSPGLYYQIVGRGFRIHPNKEDCLILDFGGNVIRHGPVDAIKAKEPSPSSSGPSESPAKECPDCHELIAAGYAACPECGHQFPPPASSKHDSSATSEGVISGEKTRETRQVLDPPIYSVHYKRNGSPADPRTMRVEYRIGFNEYISEWICLEHQGGYARQKAQKWWRTRSRDPIPSDIKIAVAMAESDCLAEPTFLEIERTAGDRFPRIVGYELGEIPEPSHDWAHKAAQDFVSPTTEPASQADTYGENSFMSTLGYTDDDIPF